ncbi:MAG TPA: 2-dehydropantoate 2-reductase, partial [Planctomycetaceae bacterium]|nr:2-dehydropantoate 2-reductase [Planctomycetaceae bacterium]
ATDAYREYLWDKIIYNCALNPLGALLGANYGTLAGCEHTRRLMDAIMAEAIDVCNAAAIPLFWSTAAEYRRHFYEELIPPTAKHYPSMLRDLERRGRTEIESLNGAVARLGADRGVPTPVNSTVTSMIKSKEQMCRRALEQ